jgi:hypothetical protein
MEPGRVPFPRFASRCVCVCVCLACSRNACRHVARRAGLGVIDVAVSATPADVPKRIRLLVLPHATRSIYRTATACRATYTMGAPTRIVGFYAPLCSATAASRRRRARITCSTARGARRATGWRTPCNAATDAFSAVQEVGDAWLDRRSSAGPTATSVGRMVGAAWVEADEQPLEPALGDDRPSKSGTAPAITRLAAAVRCANAHLSELFVTEVRASSCSHGCTLQSADWYVVCIACVAPRRTASSATSAAKSCLRGPRCTAASRATGTRATHAPA